MSMGLAFELAPDGADGHRLVQVTLGEHWVSASLENYERRNTGPYLPVRLDAGDCKRVPINMADRFRYVLTNSPIPFRWRWQMPPLGSSRPTRAICSSQIPRICQSVLYPILPDHRLVREAGEQARREILHSRHHSLLTPRDFDLLSYFRIVNPYLEGDCDHGMLTWADTCDRVQNNRAAYCAATAPSVMRSSA